MEDNKITKVLESDLGKLIRLICVISAFIAFFYWIKLDLELVKKDLSTIKNNELMHIQMRIDENYKNNQKQDESLTGIGLQLERIITILEK